MAERRNPRIELLTEDNFETWIIDIRAELRDRDLWDYTQDSMPKTTTGTAVNKWAKSAMKAADAMTPNISPSIKQKLTNSEFNDDYVMLSRLTELIKPTGDAEFMPLSKEFYTIDYESFDSMSNYLTHIKLLDERIEATKIELTRDKRILLCLSMSFPEQYQHLARMWSMTNDMTADKARSMLLEEERRTHKDSQGVVALAAARGKPTCKYCKKSSHMDANCWDKHGKPDWAKEKDQERKRKKPDDDNSGAYLLGPSDGKLITF